MCAQLFPVLTKFMQNKQTHRQYRWGELLNGSFCTHPRRFETSVWCCCDFLPSLMPDWFRLWWLFLQMCLCTKVCEYDGTQVWLSFLWLHDLIIRITACLGPLALQSNPGSTMQTNIPVMLIHLLDLYLVKMVMWLPGFLWETQSRLLCATSLYWPVPPKHSEVKNEA